MRVVLLFPAPRRDREDPSCALLPVGLLGLAAVLRAHGHRVLVIHTGGFGEKATLRAVRRFRPGLVGLSCFTYQRHLVARWARRVRASLAPATPFVAVGGPHASALPREILDRWPWIDAVAEGEAEATVLELAHRLEAGADPAGIPGLWLRRDGPVASRPPPPAQVDLDRWPSTLGLEPFFRGVDWRVQERHRVTGRGCRGGCRFCCAPALWRERIRRHSLERVLSEIRALRRRGHAWLSFRDDSFVSDPDWTAELCRRLIRESPDLMWDCQADLARLDNELIELMRRAGCMQIQLGVESADDRVLRALGKPHRLCHIQLAVDAVRRVGLWMSFYLMAGCPAEDRAARQATIELVRRARPASLSVSRLSLYPGTALARRISPDRFFRVRAESLFYRSDPAAIRYANVLRTLARDCLRQEPYTIEELALAEERTGGAPSVRLTLAQAALRQGEYLLAEMACRRWLRDRPRSAWARFTLAEIFFSQGRRQDAAAELERALDRLPNWREARRLLSLARRRGPAPDQDAG
jgi:radical SAM superfamily enzyme YgiQ (UPF0313 family)